MDFVDLRLAEPIVRAVSGEGYTRATAIQAGTIPQVMAGRDVLGSAQTGTGKTAAFALPVLHRLAQGDSRKGAKGLARCLVLCPTRELASQIGASFATYGRYLGVRGTVIYGGVNQNPQVRSLRRGVDVIVATPGRLQDLMGQGHVDLSGVQTLVLDEADRMLDMGFIQDIERIVERLAAERQTLLFSATMPVGIRRLAERLLRDPATVSVRPESPTVDSIDQSVYYVQKKNKPALLAHLLSNTSISRALVFTRTKHGADRLTKQLRGQRLEAAAIHGNKTQNARARALRGFATGRTHVLVATDIAARGLDVAGISHVFNYDLTHEPETYVHRIGRTARAGASGVAVSFCDEGEGDHLRGIERLLGQRIALGADGGGLAESGPVGGAPGRRGGGTGSGLCGSKGRVVRRGGGRKGSGVRGGGARSAKAHRVRSRGKRGKPGKGGKVVGRASG